MGWEEEAELEAESWVDADVLVEAHGIAGMSPAWQIGSTHWYIVADVDISRDGDGDGGFIFRLVTVEGDSATWHDEAYNMDDMIDTVRSRGIISATPRAAIPSDMPQGQTFTTSMPVNGECWNFTSGHIFQLPAGIRLKIEHPNSPTHTTCVIPGQEGIELNNGGVMQRGYRFIIENNELKQAIGLNKPASPQAIQAHDSLPDNADVDQIAEMGKALFGEQPAVKAWLRNNCRFAQSGCGG